MGGKESKVSNESKVSDDNQNEEQTKNDTAASAEIDPELLKILVCPLTKCPLKYNKEANELISEKARLAYPVRNGIPIMLQAEARNLDETH